MRTTHVKAHNRAANISQANLEREARKLKYRFVDGGEVFDDDNEGYLYGIESDEDFPEYVEWFKSSKARESYAKKNKMKIINR